MVTGILEWGVDPENWRTLHLKKHLERKRENHLHQGRNGVVTLYKWLEIHSFAWPNLHVLSIFQRFLVSLKPGHSFPSGLQAWVPFASEKLGKNYCWWFRSPAGRLTSWATFKTLLTFHYTGWLIGILITAYYNPNITGWYNPLFTANNEGFGHCSVEVGSLSHYLNGFSTIPGGVLDGISRPSTVPKEKLPPKRKRLYSNHPFYIHFQVRTVSFREGTSFSAVIFDLHLLLMTRGT